MCVCVNFPDRTFISQIDKYNAAVVNLFISSSALLQL